MLENVCTMWKKGHKTLSDEGMFRLSPKAVVLEPDFTIATKQGLNSKIKIDIL